MVESRTYRRMRGLGALAVTLTLVIGMSATWAASHREAPLIALDPGADVTDVYAFRSWQDPDNVVLMMNVIPSQDPSDGLNYYNFDDTVLHRIHIDNNQDGVAEDLVYEIRFHTEMRPILGLLNFPINYIGNPNMVVPALRGITELDGPGATGLTRRQTYTVTEVRGATRTPLFQDQMLIAVPSNVGPATMPDYETLAAQGIFTDIESGIRVFAGQRAETFYADLGAIFDTLNLRRSPPLLTEHQDRLVRRNPFGVNRFSGVNVHSIVLELPIAHVTSDSQPPDLTTTPLIGVYASTSREKEGNAVQVARLANPLVNALLIDTLTKDDWNASKPETEMQYQDFYKFPSMAQAFLLIFGLDVPATPRTDLMGIFLKYPGQALDGVDCGSPCAELLRLDLRVPPTPPNHQNRLGAVLGDDPAGWPNGRRPNDDVVDIAMRALGGPLYIENRASDGVNTVTDIPGAGRSDGAGYGSDPGNRLDVSHGGIVKEFPFLPTPHDGRNRQQMDCGEEGVNPCN